MGIRNVVHAVRIRWYLPLIVAVVALAAHEGWETWHGPARYVSVSPVKLDLSRRRAAASSGSDRRESAARQNADREIDALLDQFTRPSGPVIETVLSLAANAEVELPTPLEDSRVSDVEPPADPQDFLDELRRAIVVRCRWPSWTLEVEARCGSAAASRLYSWITAETLSRRLDRDLRDLFGAERDRLETRRERLETEWKDAIAAQLEFSRDLGVADVEEREALLKRLIAELDEESSRLEVQQLELARRIEDRRRRRSSRLPTTTLEGDGGAAGSTVTVADAVDPVESVDADAGEAGDPAPAESEEEKVRRELLDARLEYEVQSEVVSRRHPRLFELEKRIAELERRSVELAAASNAVDPRHGARRDAELIDAYRADSLRIDTLEKKRQTLLAELTSIQTLRPEIVALERRVADARDRLRPVRERLGQVEFLLAREARLADAGLPSEPALIQKTGVGPVWKLVAVLAGLVLGAFGAAWRLSADSRLRGEEVRRYLGLPVLAKLPTLGRRYRHDPEATSEKGDRLAPASVRESFTATATIARKVGQELGMKSFAITSAVAGEGKSTAAIHLSCALARKGLCVALVDGDLQRPSLHTYLNLSNEVGLTSLIQEAYLQRQVIEDGVPVDEVLELDPADSASVEAVLEWALLDNLFVMTSGPSMVNPEVAVNSQAMQSALATLAELVDYVIIDTPALRDAGDALELVGLADGCILVVGSGQCERGDALWAKQLIENVETSILGVVVNRYSGESETPHGQPMEREAAPVASGA